MVDLVDLLVQPVELELLEVLEVMVLVPEEMAVLVDKVVLAELAELEVHLVTLAEPG